MRKRFKFRKLLAITLCAATVFCSVSFSASAAENEPDSTEVVEWREENVKHFDMGDGTYQAVMYAHPVHELDEDGNWQDIDFGLSLTQNQNTSVYASEASGTAFAASYTANQPLMSLSGEDDSISMSLVVPQTGISAWARQTPVAAEVTEPDCSLDTFEEAKNAKFSSTVLYEEVMPGIDLEYIADLYTVKENIIVKEPMSSYAYTFTLNLEGLYPVLMDEGCILIYDAETDEQKYEIPMPYMYDGLGNVSDAVYYTLDQINGIYYLTVTADAEWINEEGRNFPVTIDPSITVTDSTVYDTCIIETQAGSVLGSTPNLWIRSDRISYIKPASTFVPPDGFELVSATLIGYYYYYDYVTVGSLLMSAHRMTKSWTEETLTWNIASTWNNQGLEETVLAYERAYGDIGARVNSPAKIEFDITEAAEGWASGKYANYGIGLQFVSGNRSVIIKSSEAETDYRPRFTYQYADHTCVFERTGGSSTTHPHKVTSTCECGATQETYQLNAMCAACRANEKIATETETSIGVFFYLDGDGGLGAPIYAPINCYVKYTNYYDYPYSTIYDYPAFASFQSIVESYYDATSVYPSLNCVSGLTVTYYDASGTELWEQKMQWNTNSDAIPLNIDFVYTLNTKPSYAVSSAIFTMPGSGSSHTIEVVTYFE